MVFSADVMGRPDLCDVDTVSTLACHLYVYHVVDLLDSVANTPVVCERRGYVIFLINIEDLGVF
jgi:hypothetical protein